MTNTDGTTYRQRYRATGSDTTVRDDIETQEGDDDIIEIRMPIASTGEVRNQGDDPLTRDELNGMARQLKNRDIGVFPAHGTDSTIAAAKYSPFERLGDWEDAAIESRDEENLLMATARMPDPESLPAATGKYREGLAILKEQAMRGISQDASIGWREDEGFPGGVDLMEASIVGIGADWRTNTADESAETVARAALDAGADPDELVAAVRDAVDATDNLNQQNDPDDGDSLVKTDTERAEYDVGDTTVEISPPEYMVDNAARAKEAEADPDITGDCGTGVGDSRAGQIIDDAVGPDVVAEVAAYLTSHEEDVTADGGTGSWSNDEWADCGNRQYAKWGGDGSGDALDWAQGKTNEVARARDEDEPYDRARNLDDPAFAEGDAVSWEFQSDTVHGRVAGIHEQFTPDGLDDPITGDDGEAVYSIHEYDDDVEAFRRANVAKPESSLSESQKDMPPASEDNFQSMSDTDAEADTSDTTEQDGGDAETARAPGDVSEDDLLTFTAKHFDGIDEGSLAEAVDVADAEYIGGCDAEALFDFVSIVTDAEYDTVADAMTQLMEEADNDNENGGDGYDEEEDEDDEEMQSAESDDADGEQSAADESDADDTDGDRDADDEDGEAENLLRDIEEQLGDVDDAREALRNGDVDISYAAGDGEVETGDEQDSDDLSGIDLRESTIID